MIYNALSVARYVIDYSNKKDYGISNLKLQKVLYFIQAYFLIKCGTPCFKEDIEAWDFGPVVPVVYRQYKQYGSNNIPETEKCSLFDSLDDYQQMSDDEAIFEDDKVNIQAVVDEFKDYSATDLVRLTHSQATWSNVYIPHANCVITQDSIREYFND